VIGLDTMPPTPLAATATLPLPPLDEELETPALLLDLDIVDDNIARMQAFADREGFSLRPHVKSHKSIAMAERQLAAGAEAICVATASEAQVMAATTATDVLVAYPLVGGPKLDRLRELAADGRLTLVSDSATVTEGYRAFALALGREVPVLIEVDTGMNRAGADPAGIADLAHDIESGGGLRFAGIMTHAGHAHDVPGPLEIVEVARREAAIMGSVRSELEARGFEVPTVSAGSTITAPHLSAGDGITEIRPGTYIYNDLRTMGRYACTLESIAASMLATIVSVNGSRVTIDAGSKTLTSTRDPEYGYGYPLGASDARFTRMSEEHGVMVFPSTTGRPEVGDRVRILPVHVCVWMDLQPEVYGVRDGRIVERVRIDAMRHSL
jgi:D-serine deaminase-like pyridoxal phosphate-dependent protein